MKLWFSHFITIHNEKTAPEISLHSNEKELLKTIILIDLMIKRTSMVFFYYKYFCWFAPFVYILQCSAIKHCGTQEDSFVWNGVNSIVALVDSQLWNWGYFSCCIIVENVVFQNNVLWSNRCSLDLGVEKEKVKDGNWGWTENSFFSY